MSLPALYSIPTDEASWSAWSFVHAANHYDWIVAPKTAGKGLSQFALDVIDPDNVGLWIYQHQVMHNQVNALLGTPGVDLTSFDWQDPDQFQNWLNLNAAEHIRISAALGVQ